MERAEIKLIKNEIKALESEKKWDELVVLIQKLIKIEPDNSYYQRKLKKVQHKYVHEKLHSKAVQELQKKEEHNALYQIYQTLLTVFPESKELQKDIKKLRKERSEKELKERKDFYEGAQRKIKELTREGNFEDALQACYEILTHEPDHLTFVKLEKKALRARSREIEHKLTDYFKNVTPVLMEEFLNSKESFIRI